MDLKIEELRSLNEKLVDALIAALPFAEDAKYSTDFKPGFVAGRIATIRAALKAAGAA